MLILRELTFGLLRVLLLKVQLVLVVLLKKLLVVQLCL